MDHRDRAAPVALARDAPVAQAEVDLALRHRRAAQRLGLQPRRNRLLGLRHAHAIEEARVDHAAFAVEGLVLDVERRRVDVGRANHRRGAEPVLAGEVEVALVVRRAAEDGTGAVVHQHEIGDVDRQVPVRIERMGDGEAGVVAALLRRLDRRHRGAERSDLGDEGGELGVGLRARGGERVVGGDGEELRAEQRVRSRRVDLHLPERNRLVLQGEAHLESLGAADPVALHHAHLLRPALERVEPGQQVLGEEADAQEPLRQLSLLDHGAGAPSPPVDDLLVGEHGHVDRIPVHLGLLAIDQAGGEEVEKQPLLVPVVRRIAGRDLARPVEREPHALQLRPHRRDVLVGPFAGRGALLARRVLRRQAEGVPSHRVQHVEAASALVARHHVAHRVVAHVAHVDAPRGIGKHLQHVVFRLGGGLVARGEDPALLPDPLPVRLRLACVVAFGGHGPGGVAERWRQ